MDKGGEIKDSLIVLVNEINPLHILDNQGIQRFIHRPAVHHVQLIQPFYFINIHFDYTPQ
jgi:hypothetical protein